MIDNEIDRAIEAHSTPNFAVELVKEHAAFLEGVARNERRWRDQFLGEWPMPTREERWKDLRALAHEALAQPASRSYGRCVDKLAAALSPQAVLELLDAAEGNEKGKLCPNHG